MGTYNNLPADLLHKTIRRQLPDRVVDQIADMAIMSDAFHLRTTLKLKSKSGLEFETELERIENGGLRIAVRLPDTFVAHLCAVL